MIKSNLNPENLFQVIINRVTGFIEFGFAQFFSAVVVSDANYITIIEEDDLSVYLLAIRKEEEKTKPILATKELVEMLTNDSVDYDNKTIYNYKRLLHGC